MSSYRRVNLAHCLAVSVHFNAYGHERRMAARNDILGVGAGALMGDDRGCPRESSVEAASRSALVDIYPTPVARIHENFRKPIIIRGPLLLFFCFSLSRSFETIAVTIKAMLTASSRDR